MDETELPEVIATYQRAHDEHHTDASLATFAPTATVEDDGQTYEGTERIRWWLDNGASEFTYTRTLTGVEDLGDGEVLVRNHVAGNFPGGQVDLQYRFRVEAGLITNLVIAP
jgi:hypothetical protein